MIFLTSSAHDAGHGALREHIEHDIRMVLGEAPGAADVVGEIAAALATTWAIDFRRATLPSLVYPLLASRSLFQLGRRGHAERLLRDRLPAGQRAAMLLRVMDGGGPSLRVCALLAGGVLRPAVSSLCRQGQTWVVDVDRLAGPGPVLELQLLATLRRTLETAAGLFDRDAGSGLVVLTGAPESAYRGRRGLPGGRELCLFSRDVLARTGNQRGWTDLPGVHIQTPCRPGN